MKALLLREYKHLEITEAPEPEIGDNDILVRVSACGICGSDVHGYDGGSGRRIPPLIMGHEAAGVVERIGTQVNGFEPGDRVTFDSTVYCNACAYCEQKRYNLCDNRMVLGVSCGDYRRNGAFAEFVSVPQHICYKLPDELPFEHAALIEAVSVAVHAEKRTPIRTGDVAVVVGTGMIGLLVVQALKQTACEKIIAVDVEDDRLALARRLGADETINASRDEVPEDCCNVAFEVVGQTPTMDSSIKAVRKGGSVTLVGNISPRVELALQAVVTRELTLYGSCASSGEYPECIELLASRAIDVEPIISAKAPLEEGPDWFSRLYDKEPGLMKVVLQP
ncbi:MAG: galactitol-1-phosphate 5-dehydrogenase [Verrucomicrobiota bacterium]